MEPQGEGHPSWRLEEPWPATLVAPISGADAPAPDDWLAGVAGRFGAAVDVLEMHGASDEKRPWSVVVRIPDHPAPVLLACEKTKRMDELPPDDAEAISAARWCVVVESLLSPGTALQDWARLARVVGGDPRTVAMMDATTGRWFSNDEIRHEIFDSELGPPQDVLWRVQVISTSEELEVGLVWIMTRGLSRCGLPELELLEVPGELASAGVRLLELLGGLLLEDGMPPPELPYPLGPDLNVAMLPWSELVGTLDPDSLGSVQDREALSQELPNPFLARRGVVCGTEPRGAFKRIWTHPREVLHALRAPDVVVYRSDAEVRRSASTARRSWARAVEAWKAGPDASVLLAGIPVGEDRGGRIEHGWVQVDGVDLDGGRGRLLRETLDGQSSGGEIQFHVGDIDGWRLVEGDRTLTPEDLPFTDFTGFDGAGDVGGEGGE